MIDVWMMFAMIIPFLEVLLYSYKHTLQNKATGILNYININAIITMFLTSYFFLRKHQRSEADKCR